MTNSEFVRERGTACRRWLGARHGILLAPKLTVLGLWATPPDELLRTRPHTIAAMH
jgi:hypothetical protein